MGYTYNRTAFLATSTTTLSPQAQPRTPRSKSHKFNWRLNFARENEAHDKI
ncbi:hypothetical protein [Burkholderia ubonensis]|uniref:hypothetical protein n=1 Tax=Burkholderia ubonensis TaxID=101571 RepID=UPI000B1857F0|nr:hypothetical protein [Burkholderia ubonensis]